MTEYRPRIEGLFARIEKWEQSDNGNVHWRSISRDNVKSFYGTSDESKIRNPEQGKNHEVFSWLLSHTFDDKGNLIIYRYKTEDFKNIPNHIFEKNKINNCTNVYLKKVVYGNRTPYKYGDSLPVDSDYRNEFMFHTLFDYGEHDLSNPLQVYNENPDGWSYRKDAFSSFRTGFDIRTYRRCRRVLQFHCFDELSLEPYLVKSMEFIYNHEIELVKHGDTIGGFSFLKEIVQKGHKLNPAGDSFEFRALPPMEFSYQQHEWDTEIKSVSTDDIKNMPIGINGSQYQWTDLYNEGISGVLFEHESALYYKHNLGNGKFSQVKQVAKKPSVTGLTSGVLQLQDLDSNGEKQLVSYNKGLPGYFQMDDEDSFQPMKNFETLPNQNFNIPNSKFIDLNGDGRADLLITEDDVFTWYPSKGKKGFDKAISIRKPKDEEEGPVLVFADSTQSVFLADMIGDGLTDIVRIRNGEVCFWANKGHSKFSKKVSMGNAPAFDHPESFNPSFIRLSDIDGSGTADIIYLGKDNFKVWINQNGNEFIDNPKVIDPFFKIDNIINVQMMDFLGTGTSCIVYSSPHTANANTPLQYIDLMGSCKPHLMNEIKNNFGKKTTLSYCSSTKFYLEDKMKGTPWITKLPFPVHVLEETETVDVVSETRFVSFYSYHHGYYDHVEKEFRGFGRVEQKDTEDYNNFIRNPASNALENNELHQPPVLTKSWFHTGAYIRKSKILEQYAAEYYQNADEHKLHDAHIEYIENGAPHVGVEMEAYRACKSMLLRKEVYSYDNDDNFIETPYLVEQHNCHIKQLQAKDKNKHASFLVLESEAITYQYEQNQEDPRIAHSINIEIDDIGNVLKALSVVYPRKLEPEIPQYSDTHNDFTRRNQVLEDQKELLLIEQKKHLISYSENRFTNDLPGVFDNEWDYRLRLPCETKLYEVSGLLPDDNYFQLQEIKNKIAGANKKLLQHQRSIYLKNDLSGPLVLGKVESLALPYETYLLAYNDTLLADNFGGKVNTGDLLNAQYRLSDNLKTNNIFPDTDNDDEWWIPSGRVAFSDNALAQDNFYQADEYLDPFGEITLLEFSNHGLYISKITDAIGNETNIKSFDYRHLAPLEMEDPNLNLTEVRFNMLGLVSGLAIKGKGDEADNFTGFSDDLSEAEITSFFNNPVAEGRELLKNATTRFIYDFIVELHEGENIPPKPLAVASIIREEHTKQNSSPNLQYAFEYSGGLGQTIMQKMQAPPGDAYQINEDSDKITVNTDTSLRWIGTGRTILNNKGNPVKQFEPYFSVTHKFESDKQLVEIGYSPIMYYDALGRLIKTDNPDGTFSKVEFDAWQQKNYDVNDNVMDSDWYQLRTAGSLSGTDVEKKAATLTAIHYNTPSTVHLDALGRPVYTIEHNIEKTIEDNIAYYSDAFYGTFIKLDLEGQQEYIQAAKGATIIDYKYDLAGNPCYQNSRDAGEKWTFPNVLGNPVYTWDANGNRIESKYDELQRPINFIALKPDGNSILFEKTVYGDRKGMSAAERNASQQNNLIGQVKIQYDGAGKVEIPGYDFKGNPFETIRKVCKQYDGKPDWNDESNISFLNDDFTSKTAYDALNRVKQTESPDKSIHTPLYNESGQLKEMRVKLPETYTLPSGLDVSHTNGFPFVKNIWYDAKGQRTKIQYGNNTLTTYKYDEKTFRLKKLKTTGGTASLVLQDLSYTYDPVGNIIHISDASQKKVFFKNDVVDSNGEYEYDALYRLIEAKGREHAANNNMQVNNNELPCMTGIPHENNKEALRNYTQRYYYDELGNITWMRHSNGNDIWNRFYHYNRINEGSNRLSSTSAHGEPYNPDGYPNVYKYDGNGNMLCMPHLPMRAGSSVGEEIPSLIWDFENQLQEVDLGTGGKAYYAYDSNGQRVRKTIVNDGKRYERIYLGTLEIYRVINSSESDPHLERWTLRINDDTSTIAQTDTKTIAVKQYNGTIPDKDNPLNVPLVRFQYSNHLGTATIETDLDGTVITYEEYHPYGTSAYRSSHSDYDISLKRYRYTGKERDEETGLYYYGARYYSAWLGKWCSCDPAGFADNYNLYWSLNNNPILYIDSGGLMSKKFYKTSIGQKVQEQAYKHAEHQANAAMFLETTNRIVLMKAERDIVKKDIARFEREMKSILRKMNQNRQRVKELLSESEELGADITIGSASLTASVLLSAGVLFSLLTSSLSSLADSLTGSDGINSNDVESKLKGLSFKVIDESTRSILKKKDFRLMEVELKKTDSKIGVLTMLRLLRSSISVVSNIVEFNSKLEMAQRIALENIELMEKMYALWVGKVSGEAYVEDIESQILELEKKLEEGKEDERWQELFLAYYDEEIKRQEAIYQEEYGAFIEYMDLTGMFD